MFRKMPFILLAMILLATLIHPWIPLFWKSAAYAVSLSLKSIIVFVLPLLIFSLLFKTATQLAKKASKIIFFLLGAICLSNFFSTTISYFVGHYAYTLDFSMAIPDHKKTLLPAWEFSLPKFINNDLAMFSGLISGVLLALWKPVLTQKITKYIDRGVAIFLKGFLGIIPLFILGFVIKMNHDQIMKYIFCNYLLIFFLVGCAVYTYIALLYFAVNRFQKKEFLQSLKNMLPGALVGFGSMSSAAAMPLTIIGVEKNAKNPDLARSFIPATVNIHLIGDCFAIPIFAFAVLKNFGVAEPTLLSYFTFALYFVLAKFSVAAVPGGGILVMLPILESCLGFNAGMLSLITMLYILFDPIITPANILGNGGFVMALDRILDRAAKKAKV